MKGVDRAEVILHRECVAFCEITYIRFRINFVQAVIFTHSVEKSSKNVPLKRTPHSRATKEHISCNT